MPRPSETGTAKKVNWKTEIAFHSQKKSKKYKIYKMYIFKTYKEKKQNKNHLKILWERGRRISIISIVLNRRLSKVTSANFRISVHFDRGYFCRLLLAIFAKRIQIVEKQLLRAASPKRSIRRRIMTFPEHLESLQRTAATWFTLARVTACLGRVRITITGSFRMR